MTVMSETYHFSDGGEIVLACPTKREVDIVTEMVDLLQRYYGSGATVRMARSLRVRMHLRRLTIGDRTRTFPPLEEVVDQCGRHSEGLWKAQQHLRRSLDFASEVLFGSLDIACAMFQEQITTQSNRNLQETPDDDVQWAAKARKFHDKWNEEDVDDA